MDLLIVVEYFASKPEQKQFISRAFHRAGERLPQLMLFSFAEGHHNRFARYEKNPRLVS
jgi:hypothetical protein